MSEPRTPEPSDEELVRVARERHEEREGREAAGALLGRYRGAAYLWCFRMVRDHDRALDLAQDALLDAWRGLGSFEGRSRFSSWLFMIVRNRCRTALRPRSLTRDDEADPDEIADGRSDPESELIGRESREAIERLLVDHLEPQEQTAIWLRCVEGMPVDEITRLLGLGGASGARGLLQTARRKLRAALRRGSGTEAGGQHGG